jgi:hypothetical protein
VVPSQQCMIRLCIITKTLLAVTQALTILVEQSSELPPKLAPEDALAAAAGPGRSSRRAFECICCFCWLHDECSHSQRHCCCYCCCWCCCCHQLVQLR